ncbi:MAG: hypothetical protein H6739_04785 [Alphaproteobacteria bacterium]|nr:hypothetical protein [Alphaproteobacteria bacterium]
MWPLGQGPTRTGWLDEYALDWTAEGDLSPSAGEITTSDGVGWTVDNDGNDLSGVAVVDGLGLRLSPDSATDLDTATLTAPQIRVPVKELIPSLGASDVVRVVARISTLSLSADYQGVYLGWATDNGLGAAGCAGLELRWGHDGAAQVQPTLWDSGTRQSPAPVASVASLRVLALRIAALHTASFLWSDNAAAYANPGLLTEAGRAGIGFGPGNSASMAFDLETVALVFGALRNGGAALGPVYLERLRVQRLDVP